MRIVSFTGSQVNNLPQPGVSPGRSPLPGARPCQDPANTAPMPPRASPASMTCPNPTSVSAAATTAAGPARGAATAPTAIVGAAAPSTTSAIPSPVGPATSSCSTPGTDAARGDAPDLLGDLVADVGGGQHRLGALDAGFVLQSAEDPPLASGELSVDTGVHSKTSWLRTGEGRESPRLFAETGGFSSLSASAGLGLRLVED